MNDRDVYIKLTGLVEELVRMAEQAESLAGETGLRHAAAVIAGTAQAIYEHALDGDAH